MTLAHLDRDVEALDSFRKAAEFDPDEPVIWNNLGESLLRLEDFSAASDAFGEAIELDGRFAPAWFGRARALILLGEVDAALDACQRVLDLADPDDPLFAATHEVMQICAECTDDD